MMAILVDSMNSNINDKYAFIPNVRLWAYVVDIFLMFPFFSNEAIIKDECSYFK